jgi:hypothetical protein
VNEERKNMALTFYPSLDDALGRGSIAERIDLLMDGAERYKAVILEEKPPQSLSDEQGGRVMAPRDMVAAYNWEEIAYALREIRELPEVNKTDKLKKGELLAKLAEVYEVLRGAKLSKLEAVRLALINEANQLRGSGSQVA